MKRHYLYSVVLLTLFFVFAACDRDSTTTRMFDPDESVEQFRAEDFEITAKKMPEIIGGIGAIQERIQYPETAKDDGVEGTVYLYVYIDTKGEVANVEVAKGVRDDLDLAAIEAVEPVKFTPAMEDGEPVKVRVSIPIHFRLSV